MRRRLPDTRPAITHKFKVGGTKGYLTVGLFDDGRPGELFIKLHGSQLNGWTNAVGILTSIALQSGVPIELLVKKMEFQAFEPSGPTSHEQIKIAKSILDYVFRWMGYQFIPDYRKPKNADTLSKPAAA